MSLRLAAFLVLACSTVLWAQAPDLEPNRSDAPVPIVTFDLNFPGTVPAHYVIAVESTGRATYHSENPGQAASLDRGSASAISSAQPYSVEFTMSEGTRHQIFQLAKQANYFHGDFEWHGGRVANTGAKTLTYSDGPQSASLNNPTNGKHFQTTFNYSQNSAIQQVTSIFQRIATTIEFSNRLAHEHRYDRMSLEGELKRMEEMQKDHELLELQAAAPVLREIATDSAIFNVTRQRAIRLLRAGGVEVQGK